MEREVRYCTTEDGVRIAYSIESEGPALLWCPAFVESIAHVEKNPFYGRLLDWIRDRFRLISYDPRGIGLSDKLVSDFSSAALVEDICAVTKACGVDSLVVWGNAMSGARAIQFTANHPDLVTHLLLSETTAKPSDHYAEIAARGLAELCRANWNLAVDVISDMGARAAAPPELLDERNRASLELRDVYRESADGTVAAELISAAYYEWDALGALSSVRCPVLVVHHLGNQIFSPEAGRQMAAISQNARLIMLEGVDNIEIPASLSDPPVPAAVESFLPGSVAKDKPSTQHMPAFRAVLFTDLVGHTEMMSRLGDDRGRDVLREHERITREVLKANGGTEVKTMGDGFMASFGSVTEAVECAIALQRAFADREGEPLNVRVGVNAGEPIEEDGDLFGATVILASRIAAKAGGGEILVSDNVRSLSAGKGFSFEDHGEFNAKGIEEPVRVYEVTWMNRV